jgi:AraC-like DNA-binding protein
MVYLQRETSGALARYVSSIWYARGGVHTHRMERVLPNGSMQMIVNLAHAWIADLRPVAEALRRGEVLPKAGAPLAASVLVGMQTRYLLIDTAELDEVMGVEFRPGALLQFTAESADIFRDCETPLADVFGAAAGGLRDRLLEEPEIAAKFDCLERFLCARFRTQTESAQEAVVRFAVATIRHDPSTVRIASLTREIGYSARRFTEVFSRQVGLTPKLYARVCRFQRVVQQLHRGVEIPWAELAIDCGYYDQSHFANDFHAFSGVSPTTYSTANRTWSNHLPVA